MPPQTQSPLAMMGDSPVLEPEQDLLHFKRYVEPLVQLITDDDTETPFTIGIFGKWGTGKTTLLKMIETQMRDKDYPTIWFNPWLYQTEDNLVVPLLQTIHDFLQESTVEHFHTAAQRVATVVAQVSASVLLKTVTIGQASLEDIEKRVETYNKQRAKDISTIRTLRNKLQEVVNDLTEKGQRGRLVIYIDDLDRCVPTKIVGLLEAIKLFLDLKHTIIFIAIDKDIVQQGIQVFYKDFELSEEEYGPLTADYIDKMIQLPLYLHPLGPEQVGDYLQRLPLPRHLDDHIELFRQCLQPNPRTIKRVLNIYALNAAIVDSDPGRQATLKESLLAKLIIIQQQWNDLYRYAVTHPELLALLERVYRKELNIGRTQDWFFLEERREELHKLCTRHYRPSSQLAALFTYGESFQDVDLDEYLFMLG
jgi:molybdopterin-guanine dinucleotide biosynthesis protein